jgi:hypothetical protein
MKLVHAHESDAVVDGGGSIHVPGVPFAAGKRVRVIVLEESSNGPRRHSPQDIQQSQGIRYSLRGMPVRYDQPDEPVGVEDWDVLNYPHVRSTGP